MRLPDRICSIHPRVDGINRLLSVVVECSAGDIIPYYCIIPDLLAQQPWSIRRGLDVYQAHKGVYTAHK